MASADNDLIPTNAGSLIQNFLEKINLPEMIAGPAGKAISRLVAGAFEIPAAYLDGFAQSIKNKTDAKQLVSKELATAAGKFAANDPDIVARAVHNLLAKEYRHQKNKEEIAKKAIEILGCGGDQDAQTQQNQSNSNEALPPADVDEDWLNVFEKFAEDASTERMQTLWARILAGEIRSPAKFSLKTLRFISELDQTTASLFEKYLPLVCNYFLPIAGVKGQQLAELLQLQDSGLLTGVGSNLGQEFRFPDGVAALSTQGHTLIINAGPGYTLKFPQTAVLTRIGLEVAPIVQLPFSAECLTELISRIPKAGIKSIVLAGNPEVTLWLGI